MGISDADFRASEGWFNCLKKRHGIKLKKLCVESASVSPQICDDWKVNLLQLIKDYDTKDIFSANETGLFFKCLPGPSQRQIMPWRKMH